MANIWQWHPLLSVSHFPQGLLCHDLQCFFGQFYGFFKRNRMPISEKGVSTNTSDSVGINIYSLGSETHIFSFTAEPGASLMPVWINLHRNFFQFIRNICLPLSSGNLDRSQAQSNLQKLTGCSRNTQVKVNWSLVNISWSWNQVGNRPSMVFPLVERAPLPARERHLLLWWPLCCV